MESIIRIEQYSLFSFSQIDAMLKYQKTSIAALNQVITIGPVNFKPKPVSREELKSLVDEAANIIRQQQTINSF